MCFRIQIYQYNDYSSKYIIAYFFNDYGGVSQLDRRLRILFGRIEKLPNKIQSC